MSRKEKTLLGNNVLKGKQNSIDSWKPAFPSSWISFILFSLSDSLSLMPGEPFKVYSVPPLCNECMSHMPHSHDIGGPGTARGTSHSQGLLPCIAHAALEHVKQGERGQISLLQPAKIPEIATKGQDSNRNRLVSCAKGISSQARCRLLKNNDREFDSIFHVEKLATGGTVWPDWPLALANPSGGRVK